MVIKQEILGKNDQTHEVMVHEPKVGFKEIALGVTEKFVAYGAGTKANILRRRSPETQVDESGDNFLIVPELDLYAVFDGVSQANGAEGARIASTELKKRIEAVKTKIKPKDMSAEQARKILLALLRSVNGMLSDMNKGKKQNEKFLTTMTLSMRVGNEMIMVNIGDSRTYYQGLGVLLEQVTVDHDLMRHDLEERKGISPVVDEVAGVGVKNIEEIRMAQSRRSPLLDNRVARLLGQGSRLDFAPDVYVRKVKKGERFLLCSDGITKEVTDENLADSLSSFTHKDFKASAEEIINRAIKTEQYYEHDDKVMALIEIK
ncbi:hypothetical protein COT97_02910 [Candidatus Falkowbacteria bacterium CG10_big_fil_rev_8_21_14_0_10_39_11]|uniref:PPM-type phosphatase domain-containing protein n=1 Tax=Candidatus Falkowbacteria bacterium CG10_big_fil_rev_8_21_14_0_10_39_11 TaxID=1974565 RepID=A0A2H0V518_9BACT|nr:MAG: hypothetical protein COT97_02910 [Candidatus Falkowbacteria bacterium CG10_big_fil_rev_8_21_14_0_10_39_11]